MFKRYLVVALVVAGLVLAAPVFAQQSALSVIYQQLLFLQQQIADWQRQLVPKVSATDGSYSDKIIVEFKGGRIGAGTFRLYASFDGQPVDCSQQYYTGLQKFESDARNGQFVFPATDRPANHVYNFTVGEDVRGITRCLGLADTGYKAEAGEEVEEDTPIRPIIEYPVATGTIEYQPLVLPQNNTRIDSNVPAGTVIVDESLNFDGCGSYTVTAYFDAPNGRRVYHCVKRGEAKIGNSAISTSYLNFDGCGTDRSTSFYVTPEGRRLHLCVRPTEIKSGQSVIASSYVLFDGCGSGTVTSWYQLGGRRLNHCTTNIIVKADTPVVTERTAPDNLKISTYCDGTTSRATISWSGSKGNDGKYWVDIDDGTTVGGPIWSKGVTSNTTEAPAGFTPAFGETRTLVLQGGQTYASRVYNGTHSAVSTFTAKQCVSEEPPAPPAEQGIESLSWISGGRSCSGGADTGPKIQGADGNTYRLCIKRGDAEITEVRWHGPFSLTQAASCPVGEGYDHKETLRSSNDTAWAFCVKDSGTPTFTDLEWTPGYDGCGAGWFQTGAVLGDGDELWRLCGRLPTQASESTRYSQVGAVLQGLKNLLDSLKR